MSGRKEEIQIRQFEDLVAWQKARALAREVHQVTREEAFARDFGLANQIQRASVSIMSNIAEGYERNSQNDFHRFLSFAKASCAEVCSQLYVAHDIGYLAPPVFDRLMGAAQEVARIIGGPQKSVIRNKKNA